MTAAVNNNFLIPNGTFVVELVLFVIVLFVMARFVLPPISRTIAERQANIKGAHEEAEEGHELLRRTEEEYRATIAQARQEARGRMEEATRAGEEVREEMRRQAREEYDRQIAAAAAQIEEATRQASEQLRAQLPDLVVDTTQRVLRRDLTPELQRALADEATTGAQTH